MKNAVGEWSIVLNKKSRIKLWWNVVMYVIV